VLSTPAAPIGQLSAHGRHGGHEPFTLPRGEAANPPAGIDAARAQQPGGCCRADARQRPHYGLDPHSARCFPVLGQGLF
jgi:hypothetical protein